MEIIFASPIESKKKLNQIYFLSLLLIYSALIGLMGIWWIGV